MFFLEGSHSEVRISCYGDPFCNYYSHQDFSVMFTTVVKTAAEEGWPHWNNGFCYSFVSHLDSFLYGFPSVSISIQFYEFFDSNVVIFKSPCPLIWISFFFLRLCLHVMISRKIFLQFSTIIRTTAIGPLFHI